MIWVTLLKFFGNPKIIIAIVIAIVLGGAYYKYHSLQSDLEEATIALKQEKDNNAVLRGNIDTLTQVNAANDKILQQQAINAKTTVAVITKLSNDLKRSNQSFVDVQSNIDAIKDLPVPLTPYLKEAINGIQKERDIVNPPAPRVTVNPVPLVPIVIPKTQAVSRVSLALTALPPLPPLPPLPKLSSLVNFKDAK